MVLQPSVLRLVFLVCLAAMGLALAASPQYRMEVLPVPSGCDAYSTWHGLNEKGWALGVVTCDHFITQRAVLWTREGFTELGTFGGPNSFPYGLNAKGEVVGTAETPETDADDYHVSRPFVWDGEMLHDLDTFGGIHGAAAATNVTGVIVGVFQSADVDPALGRRPIRACVWEDDVIRDLGDLGGPEAWAYDVNERGWIVGGADTAEMTPSGLGFVHHAFLHDGRTMLDLGTLGGVVSLASSLNERGEAVGRSLTGDSDANGYAGWHAFLWRRDVMYDLGTLGGPYSEAMDINDRGQAVGSSFALAPSGGLTRRAVLWNRRSIVDLNDVVDDSEGWSLTHATAINEQGWILASAYREGELRVVLLVPVRAKPEEDR